MDDSFYDEVNRRIASVIYFSNFSAEKIAAEADVDVILVEDLRRGKRFLEELSLREVDGLHRCFYKNLDNFYRI